jgi:hypothetical protein
MSSHHFVKEGQEPALILTDNIESDHIMSLLEWAPLVVVFENALDVALQWGFKTDVVVARQASLDVVTEKVAHQAPVKIISCLSEAEFMETTLALLISLQQRQVNIATENPEVYFELMGKYADRLEVSLVDEHIKWSLIPSGKFQKWFPGGTEILIRSNFDFQTSVGIPGSRKELKIREDGIVSVNSAGIFWVGEFLKEN